MIELRYELASRGNVRARVWSARHGKRLLFFYNRLNAERFSNVGCRKHEEREWYETAVPFCEWCGGQSTTRGVLVARKPPYGDCRGEIRRLHEERLRQDQEAAAAAVAQVSKQLFGHALPDPRQMMIPGA